MAQRKIKSRINAGCNGLDESEAKKMTDWMPNLIIIGAPKSATSTLAYTLSKHESIFCCQPSEPKFFGSKYYKGWDWYSKIFSKGKNYKTRIEASTKYASSDDLFKRTPKLLHSYIPNVKLIYVTRNPLERSISHWRHLKGRFTNKKIANFNKILDNKYLYNRIIKCSMYFKQIKKFRRYFPDNQIHCLTFEDLTTKPCETLADLLDFAGVNGDPEKLLKTVDGIKKLRHENQAGAKGRAFIDSPKITNKLRKRLQSQFEADSKRFLRYIQKPENYWS